MVEAYPDQTTIGDPASTHEMPSFLPSCKNPVHEAARQRECARRRRRGWHVVILPTQWHMFSSKRIMTALLLVDLDPDGCNQDKHVSSSRSMYYWRHTARPHVPPPALCTHMKAATRCHLFHCHPLVLGIRLLDAIPGLLDRALELRSPLRRQSRHCSQNIPAGASHPRQV